MRLSKWSSDYYTFSFLLFCGNISNVISEITSVIREASGDNSDLFGVSQRPLNCHKYMSNAYETISQKCHCPYGHFNFLCYEKKCVTNQMLEEKLKLNSDWNGFTLYLNQRDNGPYNILDLNSHANATSIFRNVQNITGQFCKVNKTDYIDDLSGKLIPLLNYNVFTIERNSKKLSWKPGSAPKILHGRIIKLTTVNCKFKMNNRQMEGEEWRNPCIVFKTQGNLNITCKDPPVSSSTTSSMVTIQPGVSSVSLHSTTTAPMSSKPSVTSSVPSKPAADNEGDNDEQSGAPIGAIVGSLAGILVIAIIIILMFVWRRRKTASSKSGNEQNHKDNPTYGKNETIDLSKQKQGLKITGNELEYDYAAVDGDPRASNGAAPGIYQSLVKDPNRESVYTPLERQETNEYNKVERAPFKPARNGPTDPTYNVLERPSDNNDDYLEPGSHIDKNKRLHSKLAPQNNEPVYNVLEGPNPEGEDEPEYNVLEGPNQEGEDEPEYNVLEDPDGQDEPEYNVLEDPDDNYDNAPVETARGHPSSHDNVGYASTIDFKKRQGTKNEPVYEAPEGPSSELTYQPLQINGQDNVYQPLDRTSRTIPDDQPVYHVLESQGSEA